MYICLIKTKKVNFTDFMKKHNIKDDTMNESLLQKIYNYPIYPTDSKIYSEKGFVNIDKGSQSGSHLSCFIVKDKKSYYFDSFGGALDKFLLKQLPKTIIYHNYKKNQDKKSRLCGSYYL